MKRTDRGRLIRQRLLAIRGFELGPVVPKGPRKARREPKGVYRCHPYGPPPDPREVPVAWVYAPNEPKAKPVRTKRLERVSPLLRLAARYPVRLPQPERR